MSDDDTTRTNYPKWTDDQWKRVTDVVSQEAQKARVAAEFLSLYGPLPPDVVAVPNLLLGNAPNPPWASLRAPNRLTVNSLPNLVLTTLSVHVVLQSHEVADPELSAALAQFRRAAVTIARLEDALMFNGQPGAGIPPIPVFVPGWMNGLPPVFAVSGGTAQAGLVPAGAAPYVAAPAGSYAPRLRFPSGNPVPLPAGPPGAANMRIWGNAMVPRISQAIGGLEGNGHSGPFACFLSPDAFEAAHTPNPVSLVLPRDRILPMLGGDYLRRTNAVPNGYGVIVALGGGPIEIVVASDIKVRYLQQTPEPRFLFRVAERVALRVKEWDAIAILS
jgi:uncharacterized linocin/CFP29 family protein